jgi:hypothetical protein
MTELLPNTRDALLRVGTSTLTGALNRRGLRSMFMQDVWPVRPDMQRMVGIAFTMRFIPSREDKDGPGARPRSNSEPGNGDMPAGPCARHRFARGCARGIS